MVYYASSVKRSELLFSHTVSVSLSRSVGPGQYQSVSVSRLVMVRQYQIIRSISLCFSVSDSHHQPAVSQIISVDHSISVSQTLSVNPADSLSPSYKVLSKQLESVTFCNWCLVSLSQRVDQLFSVIRFRSVTFSLCESNIISQSVGFR